MNQTTTVRIDTRTRDLARALLAARPGLRNQSELIHYAVSALAERTLTNPPTYSVTKEVIEELRAMHAQTVAIYSQDAPDTLRKRTTTRRPVRYS